MPGPYRSILNAYRAEIADLRKTHPPTPYSQIAEILKEKYNVVIRASSIWSFVKARSIEGERKLKYVMAESPPAQSQLSQAAPTAPQIHNAKKIEPSPEIEADHEGAKPFKVNKP
jgi:transposase